MEEFLFLKDLINVDKWIIAYLIFVAIDTFSGILKAWKIDGFKSRRMREGIIKVVTELLALVFAAIVDYILSLNVLLISVKLLLVSKEALSIIENFGQLGFKFPPIVIEKIQDLNPNKEDKEDK